MSSTKDITSSPEWVSVSSEDNKFLSALYSLFPEDSIVRVDSTGKSRIFITGTSAESLFHKANSTSQSINAPAMARVISRSTMWVAISIFFAIIGVFFLMIGSGLSPFLSALGIGLAFLPALYCAVSHYAKMFNEYNSGFTVKPDLKRTLSMLIMRKPSVTSFELSGVLNRSLEERHTLLETLYLARKVAETRGVKEFARRFPDKYVDSSRQLVFDFSQGNDITQGIEELKVESDKALEQARKTLGL